MKSCHSMADKSQSLRLHISRHAPSSIVGPGLSALRECYDVSADPESTLAPIFERIGEHLDAAVCRSRSVCFAQARFEGLHADHAWVVFPLAFVDRRDRPGARHIAGEFHGEPYAVPGELERSRVQRPRHHPAREL